MTKPPRQTTTRLPPIIIHVCTDKLSRNPSSSAFVTLPPVVASPGVTILISPFSSMIVVVPED